MDEQINRNTLYATWYEFRKELGNRLGYTPLNWQWLLIKLTDPLPWNKSHMKAAILRAIFCMETGSRAIKGQRELTLNGIQFGRLELALSGTSSEK